MAIALIVASNAPDEVKKYALSLQPTLGGLVQICTGTADDVTIQKVLDFLPPSGGTVELSSGLFSLRGGLAITKPVTLIGQGHGGRFDFGDIAPTTLHMDSGVNERAMIFNPGLGLQKLYLRHLRLDGNKLGNTVGDIINWNSLGLGLSWVDLVNAPRHGIYASTGACAMECDHLQIHECGGDGIGMWGDSYLQGGQIYGPNWFHGNSMAGARLRGNPAVDGQADSILDLYPESGSREGVVLTDMTHSRIRIVTLNNRWEGVLLVGRFTGSHLEVIADGNGSDPANEHSRSQMRLVGLQGGDINVQVINIRNVDTHGIWWESSCQSVRLSGLVEGIKRNAMFQAPDATFRNVKLHGMSLDSLLSTWSGNMTPIGVSVTS